MMSNSPEPASRNADKATDASSAVTSLRLFHDELMDRLRLTVVGDRSYITVKPVWGAPLTRPGRYLALLDGKGDEIVMLADPAQLDPISYAAVEKELRSRYLTAQVTRIVHAKQEFGASYWVVDSDRGRRDFVTQSLQENAQWLAPHHLMLVDVDGNRFEITDTEALDEHSRRFLFDIV